MEELVIFTGRSCIRGLSYFLFVILIGIIAFVTWSAIFDVAFFYMYELHKEFMGIVYPLSSVEWNNNNYRRSLYYTSWLYRIVFLIIAVLY